MMYKHSLLKMAALTRQRVSGADLRQSDEPQMGLNSAESAESSVVRKGVGAEGCAECAENEQAVSAARSIGRQREGALPPHGVKFNESRYICHGALKSSVNLLWHEVCYDNSF